MNWGLLHRRVTFPGIVDVVVKDELDGVRDAFVMCSQLCLEVSMEEDEIGDSLTEAGDAYQKGADRVRFDLWLVVKNIFNSTSSTWVLSRETASE